MTHIQKIAKYILSTLLLIMGMTLYGQNDLHFSYECQDKTLSPIKAKILLKSPDKEIFNLFSDTVSNFVFSGKNYISGTEINTDISIEFDYRERLIKKKRYFYQRRKSNKRLYSS
jgi:hypothetical protein